MMSLRQLDEYDDQDAVIELIGYSAALLVKYASMSYFDAAEKIFNDLDIEIDKNKLDIKIKDFQYMI